MNGALSSRAGLAFFLAFICTFSFGQMNDHPTLFIGDPAPALANMTFVRGTPIRQFEKGKVYVVDFWATWCGGCIAAFPHISAIMEKYVGRVQFISVESYEELGENKGKDPVVVTKKFLKTERGERLKLDVGCDPAGNPMYVNWVKVLRRNGFPTTFVIDQDGKIAWIDVNIDRLDWVLSHVLAGDWDKAKAAFVMKGKDDLEDLMIKGFQVKDSAEKRGSLASMVALYDRLVQQYPDRNDAWLFYKWWADAEINKANAVVDLEEMAVNPLVPYINLTDAAGLTARRNDLTAREYKVLAAIQERLLLNPYSLEHHGGRTVEDYSNLADTYQRMGEKTKARANYISAINMAKTEKESPAVIHTLQEKLDKVNL